MGFKLLLRNLVKDRFYTLLNILGLAVGIAMAIVTFLYLQNELSYDQHFKNKDRIYRVATSFERTNVDSYAISGTGMGPLMALEYPEIEAQTSYNFRSQRYLYKYEEKALYLDDLLIVDSNVFEIFEHDFIWGNPETALDRPYKMVLSRSVAHRFFGDTNPVGKIIKEGDDGYEITGVFEDLPDNTHLKYGGLISRFPWERNGTRPLSDHLWSVGNYVYILLKEGSSVKSIEEKLDLFINRYADLDDQVKAIPILQPLTDIHFKSELPYDQPTGNMNYIYSFFIIGSLILLLAAINYINLTTARATNRAKEVGIKKVVGVTRGELILYFLMESIVMTFVAMLIALGFVEILLNLTNLNQVLDKSLELSFINNPTLIFWGISLVLGISLLAGLYPAFYLSGIEPINALKGSFKNSKSGLLTRKTLVVLQFMISIGVVSLTLLMIRQIDFLRNKDLGFAKENLMTINLPSNNIREKIPVITEALLKNKNILGVSHAREVPGVMTNKSTSELETETEGFQPFNYSYLQVGDDYVEVMDMEILEGRDFDKDRPNDYDDAFIVNESMVKDMGWKNPIGKRMKFAEDSLGNQTYGSVIGIVKNFNIHSLHQEVGPTVLWVTKDMNRNLHVRITGQDIPKTINWIKKQWPTFAADAPLEFTFMEETFDKLYNSDERQSKLLSMLSLICVIISCLGLFGLTSYSTEQRRKEIGVRKVLGASTPNLINLLFKDILRVVLIASVIALPITYWAYNNWSQSFAYRESVSYLILSIVAVAAVVIAFLTIIFHALRVANANPIESLRTE